MYKFYIFNEGNTPLGPYSATEIKEMELEKGTLVFELTINDGEPTPIEEIDIDYLCGEESETQEPQIMTKKATTEDVTDQKQQKEDGSSIVNKWNWGAFALPVIWGLFNGVYWPIIVGIIATVARRIADNNANMEIIYYSIFAILLTIRIILGLKGNKMAWEHARKHQRIEKFESSQKTWGIIGIASVATSVLVAIIVLAI